MIDTTAERLPWHYWLINRLTEEECDPENWGGVNGPDLDNEVSMTVSAMQDMPHELRPWPHPAYDPVLTIEHAGSDTAYQIGVMIDSTAIQNYHDWKNVTAGQRADTGHDALIGYADRIAADVAHCAHLADTITTLTT